MRCPRTSRCALCRARDRGVSLTAHRRCQVGKDARAAFIKAVSVWILYISAASGCTCVLSARSLTVVEQRKRYRYVSEAKDNIRR